LFLNGAIPAPLIPNGRKATSEAEINAVEGLNSPWLTHGPAVPGFQQAFAAAV
jgi:hypothetical protein